MAVSIQKGRVPEPCEELNSDTPIFPATRGLNRSGCSSALPYPVQAEVLSAYSPCGPYRILKLSSIHLQRDEYEAEKPQYMGIIEPEISQVAVMNHSGGQEGRQPSG